MVLLKTLVDDFPSVLRPARRHADSWDQSQEYGDGRQKFGGCELPERGLRPIAHK